MRELCYHAGNYCKIFSQLRGNTVDFCVFYYNVFADLRANKWKSVCPKLKTDSVRFTESRITLLPIQGCSIEKVTEIAKSARGLGRGATAAGGNGTF